MAEYDLSDVNLPFSLEAENSVLGAVLVDGSRLGDVIAASLHPEHFYVEKNKRLFEIMSSMYMSNTKVDIVTLTDAAVRHSVFETASEARTYLTGLMEAVPSVSMAVKYAQITTDRYLLRSLILASKEIIDTANNSAEPANNILDFAEQKIYDIGAGVENKALTPISSIIYDRVSALSALKTETEQNGGTPVLAGIPTGFIELDKRVHGLNKTELIILAARPGMGKTSFAMNIAVNAAQRMQGKQICVFSLEMAKTEIVTRMLCSEARVNSEVTQTGRIANEQFAMLMKAAEFLQNLDIYIDDTPGCSVMSIKSKLRRMNNLGLVIIDYLQLMNASGRYNGNRVLEISEITRNLKIMAKELNVPIIALSQLSRNSEQRPDKHPMLSDLRDSGSIEQDADMVMFLHNNSKYDKNDPNQNVCECIVAKNRRGETGRIYLGWQGECTRFYNIDYKVPDGG